MDNIIYNIWRMKNRIYKIYIYNIKRIEKYEIYKNI